MACRDAMSCVIPTWVPFWGLPAAKSQTRLRYEVGMILAGSRQNQKEKRVVYILVRNALSFRWLLGERPYSRRLR
jgi:hypothetical protein